MTRNLCFQMTMVHGYPHYCWLDDDHVGQHVWVNGHARPGEPVVIFWGSHGAPTVHYARSTFRPPPPPRSPGRPPPTGTPVANAVCPTCPVLDDVISAEEFRRRLDGGFCQPAEPLYELLAYNKDTDTP